MPSISSCIRIQPHDRGDEQVVAFSLGADFAVPGGANADAKIDSVKLWVEYDGIPHGPASAVFVPVPVPCRACQLVKNRIRRLPIRRCAGISRDRIEAPNPLSCGDIIGTDIATYVLFATRVADDHLVVEDPWSSRD